MDLRSSQVQSVEGGYGATVGETGPEETDEPIVPGARFYDLVPVRELPYGPAAPSLHQRPDRWQHPTTCRSSSKTVCTWWGVHRWVHGLAPGGPLLHAPAAIVLPKKTVFNLCTLNFKKLGFIRL